MDKLSAPLVSLVMLNYNGLDFLKQTVPALLRLSYPDIEIIVVDNDSRDESVAFLNRFKQIKLISQKTNIGYSAGKNSGVKSAMGDYVLLLDNDILIRENVDFLKLIKVCVDQNAFLQIPLVDIGQTKTKYYGIYYSLYGDNAHKKEVDIELIKNYNKDVVKIGGCGGGCMFFCKEDWLKVGGFDESQMFNIDDVDLGPRIWIFGYKALLFTKYNFIHLGINKTETAEQYSSRFKLLFSGHARAMIKNFNIINLFFRFPFFLFFQILKTVKYSFKKGSNKIFFAFLSSIAIFLHNLKDTIREKEKKFKQ